MEPTWTIFMKDVDLGEPTSFLDHVYFGCTQECVKSAKILWQTTDKFDPRISAGAKENCRPGLQGNLMQKQYFLGPTTWKVMQRNALKDVANLRIKQLRSYTKSQLHAWMTINVKKKKMKSVGELSTVCSQIVLKCLYLACIGRPDISWSVNKLVRAVTKWTKSCDRRLHRLISYISSHKWISAVLLCRKHSTTMQTWIVSRLWFCRRPWGIKINIRRCLVYFRKSHVCAIKLDVQETDFSFTQFYRSWNHFSRCRFTHRRYSRSHSLGFGVEVFHSAPNRTDGPKTMEKPVGSCWAKHA